MRMPTLWKLHAAARESLADAGGLAAALRQHLRYTPAGLTSILLQIEEQQSAYLVQRGCAGCALGRCEPGCRVDLLRRVLAVGYPRSELSPVNGGLLRRPYTRAVVAWPGVDAQPLDASVLQGWTHARLNLHWRHRRRARQGQPELQTGVVLQVGEGADDPRDRLHAVGWHGVSVSRAPGWLRPRVQQAPWWAERRWPHDPYLLTPVAAAAHWLMTPPTPPSSTLSLEAAAGYANAATIVQHLEQVGARAEMLDLNADGWTARVAATTPAGGDPALLWEALRVAEGPLEVRDRARGEVALDPAQARSDGVPPPLLHLGMRPDGSWRWRPISATHHLVLSGVIESEVILGMVAPLLHARPELRVGVIDLAEGGDLALDLVDLPGRLLTEDGRNPYELLGAIGGLPDAEQPVLVVLRADAAAPAEAAALLFLRAALYRSLSLVLIVPSVDAIPLPLRDRCPRVTVRERVAQWQAPEGRWEWAYPTVLRLPWRDARLPWSHLPGEGGRRATPLPPLEGFWAVPFELEEALASDRVPQTPRADEALPPIETALPPVAEPTSEEPAAPERGPLHGSPGRCRIYAVPVEPASPVQPPASESAAAQRPARDARAPLPPLPAASADGAAAVDRNAAPELSRSSRDARLPSRGSALAGAALPEDGTYTPREDSAGNLVIDQRLLILTLQWAEQVDPEQEGVSITRFKSGVGLPSKAHSFQLRDALRLHGLIRRELKKEGWYRLLTVEEAVRAGKLPAGPWHTPPPDDVPPEAAPQGIDASAAPGPEADAVQAPDDLLPGRSAREDEVLA